MEVKDLIEEIKEYNPTADFDLVQRAFDYYSPMKTNVNDLIKKR